MRKIRQFRVYFEQVNQSYETVRVVDDGKGDHERRAIKKARREWRRENLRPRCISVEEDKLK